jgi:hypothetical protein
LWRLFGGAPFTIKATGPVTGVFPSLLFTVTVSVLLCPTVTGFGDIVKVVVVAIKAATALGLATEISATAVQIQTIGEGAFFIALAFTQRPNGENLFQC